jgi:hypothetical protein
MYQFLLAENVSVFAENVPVFAENAPVRVKVTKQP